ncbi:MAG: glycoside hydrolase family 43 protein [Bacteroidales bacterium]|nr:glycoside hydrolase family 43 protein [Bacteroidales bacterium]
MQKVIATLCSLFLATSILSAQNTGSNIPLADPFILCEGGIYYLYGTGAADGIAVCTSTDLMQWQWPDGKPMYLALSKENSYGDKWFWAPEVYHIGDLYYMYYSAEEHFCVATATSPLGPFVQRQQAPMREEKGIDNSLFIDDDGTPYLLFVNFDNGNEIWMAELEKDLLQMKPGTGKLLLKMSQDWEKVWPAVNEGPFIVKHGGVYYLTYSANSYESPAYGVGYATATSMRGPWTKYEGNPVLQFAGGFDGTGHHALFTDNSGRRRIVFHSHNSHGRIQPRVIHIGSYGFTPGGRLEIGDDFINPQLTQ